MARSIKDLQNKIEDMGDRLEEKPQQSAERGANAAAADMRANVGHGDQIASSLLLNNIQAYTDPSGTVMIESAAPYSGYVEFGTGPKHIPNKYTRRYDKPELSNELVTFLIRWAAMKPSITGDPKVVGEKVAYTIAGESNDDPGGTMPHPFFFNTWNMHGRIIQDRVIHAAKRAARL